MTDSMLKKLRQFLNAGNAPVDQVDLRAYAQYLRPKSYAKGEKIICAGEEVKQVFLMTEGLVRCYYVHDATEINLRFLTDMSTVTAYAAFVSGGPSQESIECVEASHGLEISLANLEALRKNDIVVESWLRMLAERHYLFLEQRLRMIQHKSAADRYAYFKRVMPQKAIAQIPSYHIASYLGITPQSLSRLKKALD